MKCRHLKPQIDLEQNQVFRTAAYSWQVRLIYHGRVLDLNKLLRKIINKSMLMSS